MYGSRKPDNYWQMDYDERKAWERQEQERQDLEYDKQRAQEEAKQAQADARRSRLNAQREMASMSEDYGYQIDDLESEIKTLKADKAKLLDVLVILVTECEDRPDIMVQIHQEVSQATELIAKMKGKPHEAD